MNTKKIIEYKNEIITNKTEINNFEKELYTAYSKSPQNWTFINYTKEDKKLIHIFDYKDLVIYVAKRENDNKIITGMSVHINPQNEFQCEKMGFKINKDECTCEGLTLFIIEKEKLNISRIIWGNNNNGLVNFLINDLKNRGFKTVYGTTSKYNLQIHKKIFNWQVLNSKLLENDLRYLLKREI